MTKTVRVENADSGTSFKVQVRVQDQVYVDGKPTNEWKDVKTIQLGYPTAMTPPDLYITSSRRLVVEEYTE